MYNTHSRITHTFQFGLVLCLIKYCLPSNAKSCFSVYIKYMIGKDILLIGLAAFQQRGKTLSKSDPGMTLNNLMVRFQYCRSFGDCRVFPSLPSLPDPLWSGVEEPDRVLSVDQMELCCVTRNRTVVVFWPSTRPKMPFQGDAPEGSDTF